MLKGLVIKPHWADLILDGTKTWEIRGSATKHRGPIYIIKSGTGKIYGAADLVDCIPLHGPNDHELIINSRDKHHVPLGAVPYRKPWAWVIENAERFKEPFEYDHPQGAVIWVNIPFSTINSPSDWI